MKCGLVKLGGFDLAKDKANAMVGIPYYLAPEILECKPYDTKSDIWSLGVLLYEMMTFRMPFDAKTLPMLLIKIIRGNYSPLSSIYSKDLKEIVSKCLIAEPRKRPSIEELLRMPIIQNRIQKFVDFKPKENFINDNLNKNNNSIKDKNVKEEKEKEKKKKKKKKIKNKEFKNI